LRLLVKQIIYKTFFMKQLYNTYFNKNFLLKHLEGFKHNLAPSFDANAYSSTDIEAGNNDETYAPDEHVIDFLFNYSKSLEVLSFKVADDICAITKN